MQHMAMEHVQTPGDRQTDSQAHPRVPSNPNLSPGARPCSGRCEGWDGVEGVKVLLTQTLDLTFTPVTCGCSSHRNDSGCHMAYSIPALIGDTVTVSDGVDVGGVPSAHTAPQFAGALHLTPLL